jgi:hypothetical protein
MLCFTEGTMHYERSDVSSIEFKHALEMECSHKKLLKLSSDYNRECLTFEPRSLDYQYNVTHMSTLYA